MAQAYVERRKVIITGGSPYSIDISGNSKVGTITSGTWNGTAVGLSYGGTGATTAADARTNLGLVIGTDVQAYNSTLANVAGGTYTGDDSITTVGTVTTGTWNASTVAVGYGGTGATTASGARTNLGLVIGTDVQAYNSTLANVAGGTYTGDDSITTVGTVTTGTWNASTVAVGYGGTGATTASGARTNLGLVIGTDVQAYDAELAALAGVTSAADKVPYFTGSGTADVTTLSSFGRSLIDDADASTARSTLGLGTMATQDSNNVSITGGSITANTLTVSGNLIVNGTTTTINSTELSVDDKNITLGDVSTPTNTTADGGGITLKGTTDKTFNWVSSTNSWTSSENLDVASGKVYSINGTTVLSNNALGSGVVNSSLTSVGTLTSGTWNASTVAVGYGGTGATTASGARTNLGLVIGTDVQAYDAELAALAGVTSAADKVPYFTGSGTADVTTLSSFGRSLIDDADASTARSTLGLVIGTDVQAYDAELAALAGVTSAADKVPYFTGSGTADVTTLSSFGRSLIDDADASTARSTLGLGTIATQNANNVSITGGTLSGITSLSIEGVFNTGLTLAANTYSNVKVSVRTPIVDFKSVAETSLFTVPTGYMFLIDSMEVLTTSVSGASDAPVVRFGNSSDSAAYYAASTSLSNSVGSRHVIDIAQDAAVANTVVTFGITSASTATAHSGCGIVTGYLVKL